MNQRFLTCCYAGLCSIALAFVANIAMAGEPSVDVPTDKNDVEEINEWADSDAAPLADGSDWPEDMVSIPVVPPQPDDGSPRGPGSDDCFSATPAVDGVNPFDTTAATPDGPSHDPGDCQYAESTLNNNVWFSYTASCTGTLTVATCEQLGGSATYDTRLAVYGGTCADLIKLGCNDDDLGNAATGQCGATPLFHSTVTILVTAGQNLLISVGGFGATDVGTGNLFVGCVAATATGSCCKPDTTCTDEVSPGACAAIGGLFSGFGTACATTVCPCDAVVFQDFSSNVATTIAGNFPGIVTTELGNYVHLGPPILNRDICEVTVVMQETNATYAATNGTPFDLIVSIWDACPSTAAATGACGISGATLLRTVTVPGVTIPANTARRITATFDPPLENAPNDIAVMFRTSRPGPQLQLSGAGPTIGSVPGTPGVTGTAIRCGSTTNGCTRNFAGSDVFSFRIAARVSGGVGSCCDGETGICTPNVGLSECIGANKVFTLNGECPGSCHQYVGACCLASSDSCVEAQTIPQCAAAGGEFRGDASSCAAGAQCPTICAIGSEGQPLDRIGHGAGGIVATVSDTNPVLATQVSADNFTPAVDGTITHIRWWGYYRKATVAEACPDQGGSSPDNWQITLYNDAVDLPFQVVVPTFFVTPTKAVTGWQFNGRDYARFDVTGLNIPVLQDRCYWLEIVNNTTGECRFFWATGPAGDNKSAGGSAVGVYQSGDENDYDLAWCLDIDINADGCNSAIELAGACCLEGGATCTDNAGPTACLAAGGSFVGFALSCANVNCEGACCIEGACSQQIQVACQDNGGAFQGIGASCTPNPCSGSCCLSDGSCTVTDKAQCEALTTVGGFSGAFTGFPSCANAVCPTYDICDPDGLPVLACGSSTIYNNMAIFSDEEDGAGPIFPDNPDPSCFGGNGVGDGVGNFWVTFTGTGQDIEVSTCGSVESDTVLAVYFDADNSGCGTITLADQVACSEDEATCIDPLQSKVCVANTVLDAVYYVQISSFNALSVGSITVNVTCPCPAVCACPGDTSGDGLLNGRDVESFVNCLITPGAGCTCADSDGDALPEDEFGVNGDIADFVSKLLSGAVCPTP